MTLWDWAGRAYARPGVEGLCLILQDRHGQCVSLLLWAAWAAKTGRRVEAADLAAAVALARIWEDGVLRPLRAARRALKTPVDGVTQAAQADLRDRIKAEELAAEKLLLESLATMTAEGGGCETAVADALRATAHAWGSPPPADLLEALADAFSKA
jgi:uncharacterized protein (TIGR02444 family)